MLKLFVKTLLATTAAVLAILLPMSLPSYAESPGDPITQPSEFISQDSAWGP